MTLTPTPSGRLYCSDMARLRGDDNSATASRVDVWILVELPVTWGRDPIDDAAMPEPVRAKLRHVCETIPDSRVVFIRRRVECLGSTRVYVVRSAPSPAMASIDLPAIDDIAALSFPDLLASARPDPPPLVLVCTHGQHDSCCGRRGYPLFDALRARDDLDVWQCSHIGGDRFAANAVALPWGLYYGPVEPRDANVLAESILADEIFIPAFRGRSTVPRIVQAAEIHVRRVTGVTACDALTLVSRERHDGTEIVCLRDTGGVTYRMTIERYVATEAAKLTCLATTMSPVPQFRVVRYETK